MRGEFIMAFELPALPYAYDALEPVIDADPMRFIMINIMQPT